MTELSDKRFCFFAALLTKVYSFAADKLVIIVFVAQAARKTYYDIQFPPRPLYTIMTCDPKITTIVPEIMLL